MKTRGLGSVGCAEGGAGATASRGAGARAWALLGRACDRRGKEGYHPGQDGSGKAPRYYQLVAIDRAVEAIARGQKRILLVMATGTGKTYTAFQIIWRLWKSSWRAGKL